MSPAFNGSTAIQRFECGNTVEICNGIMFYFYLGAHELGHNWGSAHDPVNNEECRTQFLMYQFAQDGSSPSHMASGSSCQCVRVKERVCYYPCPTSPTDVWGRSPTDVWGCSPTDVWGRSPTVVWIHSLRPMRASGPQFNVPCCAQDAIAHSYCCLGLTFERESHETRL